MNYEVEVTVRRYEESDKFSHPDEVIVHRTCKQVDVNDLGDLGDVYDVLDDAKHYATLEVQKELEDLESTYDNDADDQIKRIKESA